MNSKKTSVTLKEPDRRALIYLLDFVIENLSYQNSVKGFCLDDDIFTVKNTTLFLYPEQLNGMQNLLKEIS